MTDFKEQIKNQLSIDQLIGEYVQLKNSGGSLVGLCPFHKESTPSFNVRPETGYFKCFGCGKAGDIFTFIMELKGLSFVDALQQLGQKVGIEVSSTTFKNSTSKKSLLDLLAKVSLLYKNELARHQDVKEYLSKRGIDQNISDLFELGYAPDNFLTKIFKTKEELEILKNLGVVKESFNRTGNYDFFRNRLIVPIKNQTSQIIALGGRTTENKEGIPKYLNSNENALFSKRKILFGIDQAISAFKDSKKAIIVEGYFDVIIPHSLGHQNVVGCCGTSLTEEHGELLSRYVDKIILLFDGDRAGLNAGVRAFSTLINLQTEVQICILPKGEDPDSFLRNGGDWNKLIAQSRPIIEFFVGVFMQEEEKHSPQHLAKVAGMLSNELNRVENGVLRDALFHEGARLLGIKRESFGITKSTNPKHIREQTKINTSLKIVKLDLIGRQALLTAIIVPELAEQILFSLNKNSDTWSIIEKISDSFRAGNYTVIDQLNSNFQFLSDLKTEYKLDFDQIAQEAQNQLRIGGVNYTKFVKDLEDRNIKKDVINDDLDTIGKLQAKLAAKRIEYLNGKQEN